MLELGRAFYLIRWMAVPLMIAAAIGATATQDSFQWSTGPYGPVLGAWLIGYGLWAGNTSVARAINAREVDISAEPAIVKRNVNEAIATYRWNPRAKYELLAVVIVIVVAAILPETGFQVLGLTSVHMLFVFAWRYFVEVSTSQQ